MILATLSMAAVKRGERRRGRRGKGGGREEEERGKTGQ
jgi:hypothetical protein